MLAKRLCRLRDAAFHRAFLICHLRYSPPARGLRRSRARRRSVAVQAADSSGGSNPLLAGECGLLLRSAVCASVARFAALCLSVGGIGAGRRCRPTIALLHISVHHRFRKTWCLRPDSRTSNASPLPSLADAGMQNNPLKPPPALVASAASLSIRPRCRRDVLAASKNNVGQPALVPEQNQNAPLMKQAPPTMLQSTATHETRPTRPRFP